MGDGAQEGQAQEVHQCGLGHARGIEGEGAEGVRGGTGMAGYVTLHAPSPRG
jgi:hypothetical protein